MKITFKNVGQGDSIILEWQNGRANEIGLIDCNKVGGNNPVLEYLQSIGCRKIAFIILSHPHEDHFSGLYDLLDYCGDKGIVIDRFMHTMLMDPRYLNWAILEQEGKQRLCDLIKKVEVLDKKRIVNEIYLGFEWSLRLSDEWSIKILSPSKSEIKEYIKNVEIFKGLDEARCSRSANLLSTSIQLISRDKSAVILTSDTEILSFERLIDRHFEIFDFKLLLCQIPHHGSVNNHKHDFWKRFVKDSKCPAVISAGEHRKYKHPDKKVVSDFIDSNFSVYATNHINGIREVFDDLHIISKVSSILDDDSEILEDVYSKDGDQIFELFPEKVVSLV